MDLKVRTPEGVEFAYVLAGPISRFLAWFIDVLLIAAIGQTIGMALAWLGYLDPAIAQAVIAFTYFVVSFGYSIALEWLWRGQTLGKRLLRLRVIDEQGLRLQFSQVLVRNLLRAVDALPLLYVVGGTAMFLSRRAQRLGDLAASTIVIKNPRLTEPSLAQLGVGKFNSLRDYPHLEARLRHRVSPAEAAIALQSIVRREQFEPAARVAFFEEMAEHFKSIVAFPPEAVEPLTGEQYIRNVVDILFRRATDPTN